MSETRNNYCQGSTDRRGIVIDTNRVLDACRDRDCFEDARVYLNANDEGILATATNLRAVSSEILYAEVGCANKKLLGSCNSYYRKDAEGYIESIITP